MADYAIGGLSPAYWCALGNITGFFFVEMLYVGTATLKKLRNRKHDLRAMVSSL